MKPKPPTPAVINWHVTEACNYRCGYCYAHWDRPSRTEVIRDAGATRALLGELYMHFRARSGGAQPRLNIAGGEPLLHRARLLPVLRLAREIGFEVSMISNGSALDLPLLRALASELSMLGLSLDAARPEVLAQIGRVDRHGRVLDLDALAARCRRCATRAQTGRSSSTPWSARPTGRRICPAWCAGWRPHAGRCCARCRWSAGRWR